MTAIWLFAAVASEVAHFAVAVAFRRRRDLWVFLLHFLPALFLTHCITNCIVSQLNISDRRIISAEGGGDGICGVDADLAGGREGEVFV